MKLRKTSYDYGHLVVKKRRLKVGRWKTLPILGILLILFGPLSFFIMRAHASALSFVCATSAAATSVAACAGEQAGDLLVVSASLTASGTIPTLATGFTNINTAAITSGSGGNRIALRAGWNTAANSSSGSGTWTNATHVTMQVYRGQDSVSPIGNSSPTTGTATSVTYAADTLAAADGSSWFAGVAVRNTADSHMATAPTGMTNRTSNPATPLVAGHDNNGPTASNWTSTNVTGFGASASFASIVIEIQAAPSITVGATGAATANMTIPSTSNYYGGAFNLIRDVGSANVTSITLTESGTVNAASNISNLRLFYKQEAVCSTSIPSGTTAFNSTGGSFSGTGPYISTVTGTMTVGTSQICVYTQVDVGSGASSGDTLLLKIASTTADIVVSAGSVASATDVSPTGNVILVPPGPTTDQVLRGGEWFSGGAKQPFYWAN